MQVSIACRIPKEAELIKEYKESQLKDEKPTS